MVVFADDPRWARHGTVWGHLISDTSLDELHDAARTIGLHPRSFDLDHYDWPQEARTALEMNGVRFVTAGDLTRALICSGLRIPLKARAAARSQRTAIALKTLGYAADRITVLPHSAGEHTDDTVTVTVLDFVLGAVGHVDPLPDLPGYMRITTEEGEAAHVAVPSTASVGAAEALKTYGEAIMEECAARAENARAHDTRTCLEAQGGAVTQNNNDTTYSATTHSNAAKHNRVLAFSGQILARIDPSRLPRG